MIQLMANVPSGQYDADDASSLACALLAQLDRPTVADVPIEDWAQLIGTLEPRLRAVAGNQSERLTPQAT
jgi:hypothetical protein